ncbi:MAG: VCBS repeat-containing protein [Planctomycetota bacterium]
MRRTRPLIPALLLTAGAPAAQQWEPVRDMLPRSAQDSRGVTLDDFDGDGDLDPVLATFEGLLLYRNDGSAVFERELVAGLELVWGIGSADVDGDGDVDLYASLWNEEVLLRNDGTGSFVPDPGAIPPVSFFAGFVSFADVDGDGDQDCLRSSLGGSQVGLLLNDGTGAFVDGSAGVPLLVLSESVSDVATGDLDGDGDADFYAATEGDFDVVLLGDGAGAFAELPGGIPGFTGSSNDVSLADVDLDGDLDVCVAALFGDRVMRNDGAGFLTDVALPAPGNSRAVAAGDVDADGDPDVFWASSFAKALFVNDGLGGFADAALPEDDLAVIAISLGDLDGDDDLDVVLARFLSDGILLGDGAGGFVQPAPSVSFVDSNALAHGDLDGDGDLDVIAGGLGLRWLDNNGAGFLEDAAGAGPGPPGFFTAVALADLDGDGRLDAWAGSSQFCTNTGYVLRNDGLGGLQELPGAVPALTGSVRSVALADLDGDGDVDAATATATNCVGDSNANQLLLNQSGTGVFADGSGSLPPNDDRTEAIVASDLDGDGDLDLFAGNGHPNFSAGQEQNRLYANDGSGAFLDATGALPAFEDSTVSLAVGDVDADGDLDVLVGNSGLSFGGPCRLLRNDGAAFVDVPVPTLAEGEAVALVDLDEDGDLDAYVAAPEQDEAWLNDGAGAFALDAGSLPIDDDDADAVIAADFDLDGDVDVLVGGTLAYQVNVTRQLAWRGLPRAGKPLALEVRGPGGGVFGVAYSTAPAQLALPGLGTLLIDPAGLAVFAAGALDGAGAAEVGLLVPAGAAFLGVPVYWQAVVGPDFGALRFTNREVTAATAY